MARAKRTDRAEARRRYRASVADPIEADESDLDDETATPAEKSGPARPAPAVAPRPGILSAFRSSFRRIELRDDLRALPQLLRHWSFLVPVVLSGVAVVLTEYYPKEPIAAAVGQYFSGVAPLGAVFIAGFFAPRAAWLVGALVSLASAAFLSLSYIVRFAGLPDNVFVDLGVGQQLLVSTSEIKASLPGVITQALTAGPLYGAFFAAAAAWYKRFLNRASPNRQRPASTTGRRPDGKQPKRNEQRPILARRR